MHTLTRKKSSKRNPSPKTPPPAPALRLIWTPAQILKVFEHLVSAARLARWFREHQDAANPKGRSFYLRAFSPLVSLWYMVFERLGEDHTLQAVVTDACNGGADRLSPPRKPLSSQLKSDATTSYSDARKRLPLGVLEKVLRHLTTVFHKTLQTDMFHGLKLGIIDGSTLRMRPLGDMAEAFPPHRGSKRKQHAYWCLARVVGIFCASTGALMDTVMEATRNSEQNLAFRLFQRCWAQWLILGDRNFGVYSVVNTARAAQAHVLLRLTFLRAACLARRNGLILRPGLDAMIEWTPTRHDQSPAGMDRQPVKGRLMAVQIKSRGKRPLTIYLFTTVTDPNIRPEEWVQLYGRRWSVELCLRYIKTQMQLEFLDCRSADMARKEWLAGLIAYNLIRYAMGAAAAVHAVPIQTLSFAHVRRLMAAWLVRHGQRRLMLQQFEKLLRRIAKARLPQRKKKRPAEPRAIRKFNRAAPTLVGSRAQARRRLANATPKS
jgi:hypothetical protein